MTTSSVAWAYSASQTISSSSTPRASAIIATASPNTAVPSAAMPGSSGSSMWRLKPQGISVAGESYNVVSDASSIVILSMRSQMPAVAMPISSIQPGLMPVPKMVEPPASQASAMRWRSAGFPLPSTNAAVLTTSTPAARMRTTSSTAGHIGL